MLLNHLSHDEDNTQFASNANQIQGKVYTWYNFYSTGCYMLHMYIKIYFFSRIDTISHYSVL